MVVISTKKYVVNMEQDCTYAMKDGKKVLHIPKDSPLFDKFEAEFDESMFSDDIVEKYIKLLEASKCQIL